jgi:pimeloyl-ACP methyl ester carboxylesterase
MLPPFLKPFEKIIHKENFRHLGDNSHLVIIKNAGHAINCEKPKELCDIIKRYFVDDSLKTYERYNSQPHKVCI